MANDGRTQFLDGLRVTADHMQHMQDRLREAVVDLRRTVGLGRIAWGLHVETNDGAVSIQPGVAFAPSGIRLNIDAPASVNIPDGDGPWRVVLRAEESDRESLRVGNLATLIALITTASVEADNDSEIGPDALEIASVTKKNAGFKAEQDSALFVAAGNHSHSGNFVQDEFGHWHYDGPKLAGKAGDKGDEGEKGDKGDPGLPGEPGAKGDKGDPGEKGDKGDAGAKGDKGDPGEPGAKGDKGDKGEAGQAAAKGDKGDPGAKGDKGDPGAKGDKGDPGVKGDKGDPGAKGDKGDPGAKGDKGDPGVKGDKGDPGAKGDKGDPGLKGDKGDPGITGDKGDPGVKGDKGDRGEQGIGLDRDWPSIKSVSWKQANVLTNQEALGALNGIRIILTDPLLPAIIEQQPQVVEVWFESDLRLVLPGATAAFLVPAPGPMSVIHGTAKLDSNFISWGVTDNPVHVTRTLSPGGKILIRVHCGHLFAPDKRPFSAALDVVTGVPTLHAPGGVFESWFFVRVAG